MKTLTHKFVEYIPESLEDGVLYVSVEHCTAVHKCACGCGQEVVTPISPSDWKLMFDGEGITLTPSIGNWNFKCRSHYWIRRNEVQWAGYNNSISKLKKRKKKRSIARRLKDFLGIY